LWENPSDNQLSPEVTDDAGCDYRNQAGQHETVVQKVLTDFSGAGMIEVHGGNITGIVGNKEIAVLFVVSEIIILIVESDVRFEIDRIFRERGIEISFPQRDIHIRSITKTQNSETIIEPEI